MEDKKSAYIRLSSVEVCGFETITLANPAKKVIILDEQTGDPSSMSDS
jgi:hypothetical protein